MCFYIAICVCVSVCIYMFMCRCVCMYIYFSDFVPLLHTYRGAGVKGHKKRVTALTDVIDFTAMSLCDGHIISS